MKVRFDFVTNSSSSSFICEICGNIESGYDLSLAEAEMVECEKCSSIFCMHHEPNAIDDYDDYLVESCPICRFDVITDNQILLYAKKLNPNIEDEIKSKFKSYDEFMKFVDGE